MVVMATVVVSAGVGVSVVMVESVGVVWGVVTVSVVVSRTEVGEVGAVVTAVVGEVRGGRVEAMGGVNAGGLMVVGLEVVEAMVVGGGGEEVTDIVVASVGTVVGVAVVVIGVATVV